jgi:cytochrome c2
MEAGKMRRVSLVMFAGGFILLLLSFLPQPARQQELTPAAVETDSTAAAETALLPAQLAEQGQALFLAKGCPTCHRHDIAVKNVDFSTEVGPNLTYYEPDPDFVREWLRDPSAVRPGTQMPNLNLTEEEIEALVAFLEE